MLLSENSIRKIIFEILKTENNVLEQTVLVRSMEPDWIEKEEKEYEKDGETSPEEYQEAKEANVNGLKPKTKEFIARLNSYAKEKNYKKPKITSGFRGPVSQARVMFNNWKLHGGVSGGTEYLIGLYANDKLAKRVGDTFTSTNDWRTAASILKKQPVSAHGSGKAIDIRSIGHNNISEIIYAVAKEFRLKNIKIYINDETGYKNPHWHIKIG